jgi:hypothetical protein
MDQEIKVNLNDIFLFLSVINIVCLFKNYQYVLVFNKNTMSHTK